MTDPVGPSRFHQAAGAGDWEVVGDGASAYFRTGSYAEGAGLVQAIAEFAGKTRPLPDADIRPQGVTLRLVTVSDEFCGLTEEHLEVARDISDLVRSRGLVADPSAVLMVQVTVGAHLPSEIMSFWKEVLGYDQIGEEDLIDPQRRGAPFCSSSCESPGSTATVSTSTSSSPTTRRRREWRRRSPPADGSSTTATHGVVDPGRPHRQRGGRRHPGGTRVAAVTLWRRWRR